MRSTAARSSSSEIRWNSPSTTTSLTVSRQPAANPRSAPSVKRTAASISTARTPRLDQLLDFCAQEPIERVFLEDIARRRLGRFSATAENGRLTALCHVGTNVVPSGAGCDAFAGLAAAAGARMVIGEERAVGELWEAARAEMPPPRDDPPGPPGYVLREVPGP